MCSDRWDPHSFHVDRARIPVDSSVLGSMRLPLPLLRRRQRFLLDGGGASFSAAEQLPRVSNFATPSPFPLNFGCVRSLMLIFPADLRILLNNEASPWLQRNHKQGTHAKKH